MDHDWTATKNNVACNSFSSARRTGRAGYHGSRIWRYIGTGIPCVNILTSLIFYLHCYCAPWRDDAFFWPVPAAAGDFSEGWPSGRQVGDPDHALRGDE